MEGGGRVRKGRGRVCEKDIIELHSTLNVHVPDREKLGSRCRLSKAHN